MADIKCPRCNGEGSINCPKCKGRGKYRDVSHIPILSDILNTIEGDDHMRECPTCDGSGILLCARCQGNGVVNE